MSCFSFDAQAETTLSGTLVIAGNGPEQRVIETLARAFEKAHPRVYVEIMWQENSKPVEVVKSDRAQLAVTGQEDPQLTAHQIAWDGIAIMVHLSNSIKELTTQQIADLFSGKVKYWSELGGAEERVVLLDRAKNRNIRDAFERHVHILGKIPEGTKVIGPDDRLINTVAGTLSPNSAVTFLSMAPALEAVHSGVTVHLIIIDKTEPEPPTVKDGRYPLRRPILLLTTKEPDPLKDAFVMFARTSAGQRMLEAEGYISFESRSK